MAELVEAELTRCHFENNCADNSGAAFSALRANVTMTDCDVVGNTSREGAVYGWRSTLSHEYAHAYYDSSGPIWLREGIASLVEVAQVKGKGKKLKMTIPVNPPRRRGLAIYQRGKHYTSILHLLAGEKEPDGYGYSYEHGWSLHYFLFDRNPKKYRAFLKAVRSKTGRDLSKEVEKAFGMKIDALDRAWREFVAQELGLQL